MNRVAPHRIPTDQICENCWLYPPRFGLAWNDSLERINKLFEPGNCYAIRVEIVSDLFGGDSGNLRCMCRHYRAVGDPCDSCSLWVWRIKLPLLAGRAVHPRVHRLPRASPAGLLQLSDSPHLRIQSVRLSTRYTYARDRRSDAGGGSQPACSAKGDGEANRQSLGTHAPAYPQTFCTAVEQRWPLAARKAECSPESTSAGSLSCTNGGAALVPYPIRWEIRSRVDGSRGGWYANGSGERGRLTG